MMVVVKTMEQLEKAIERNAHEVMIVGKQAPQILEAIHHPEAVQNRRRLGPVFEKLNKGFDVLEMVDNNLTVEGILRQKTFHPQPMNGSHLQQHLR